MLPLSWAIEFLNPTESSRPTTRGCRGSRRRWTRGPPWLGQRTRRVKERTDPLQILAPAGPAEDDITADQAGHVPERRYHMEEPENTGQGHWKLQASVEQDVRTVKVREREEHGPNLEGCTY